MLTISSIKINGLERGLVTDTAPTIAFSLASDRSGEAFQSAVIRVGSWRRETSDQINNVYDGPMVPFARYTVHIKATGTSGESAAASADFETGRLATPWSAKWITDGGYTFPDNASPVPMTFRRRFEVKKKVCRAFFNATALGIYELGLNGKKVGAEYFAPGLTNYTKQIQYQTYDVTAQLSGGNEITAVVGGGWAAGSFTYRRKSKIYAERQAFLCELRIEYEDGTTEVIATDERWQVTLDGPYRAAEWYDGETYDATIDSEKAAWKQADIRPAKGNPRLLAQYGAPVRVMDNRHPVSVAAAPSGETIYDFGQNFSGVISAKIKGCAGQTVVFRHAEVLVDGELFVKSLRTAKAQATYICAEGEQEYSPRLTYMGFRYVGVSGVLPGDLELSAYVLHSDLPEIGSFSCSDEPISRLQENIRWGGKSNFVDIPTDCPQRDERQGWTGDIAVFASTACFNFDMSRFLDKWLLDMRAEQSRGGGFPMVIPKAGDAWPAMATACWGDSCVLVPWAEYLARGNVEVLRRQYPAVRRFLKAAKWWSGFLSVTPTGRHIWRFPFHFGDWCAPDGTAKDWIAKGKWVATAYFANSCGIAAQMADILGFADDARLYRKRRETIAKAYRKAFTDGAGKLKNEFQTAYVLPLHFAMTEGKETGEMAKNLVRLVQAADGHLATGFPGTPYLLFALSDNGQLDTAYELLLQDTCPSWLYQVKTGGTTIWERWDALRPDGTVNTADLQNPKNDSGGMVSFNHYAGGAVGDWLYRRVAGIEPTSGGYKTFRVAPMPGGGLTWAKAEHGCPYGKIVSEWERKDGVFRLTVCVPVGCEAAVRLPNGEVHATASGKYTFEIRL
jgi:alpha-L-rhamnosidase